MKLSSFGVYLAQEDQTSIDITDQILNFTVEESLFGDLSGRVEVVDATGTLDNAITGNSYIILDFKYLEREVRHEFFVDGVSAVDVTSSKTKKTYAINLKTIDHLLDTMKLIAKSFKGRSTDIIKTIFDESFKKDLQVLSDSITKGHYISPNVSPSKAINQVKNQAYDANKNPFFLFNRLIDDKFAYLDSLFHMEQQVPMATIKQTIQSNDDVNKPFANIGQPNKVVIHDDNDNKAYKLSKGVYGKNILNVDVSNSDFDNTAYGIHTNSTSITNPLRMDMYDDEVEPLLYDKDYSNVCTMNSILNMLFNTRITAYGCQAIPNVGVGDKVELELQNNKVNQSVSSKFSGHYLISNIVHRIEDNDYTQNIEMVRE